MVREHGIALFGPPAKKLIDPIDGDVKRGRTGTFAELGGMGKRQRRP